MLVYTARRLLATIPLIVVISLAAFGLVHLMPGDPAVAIAGDEASAEQIALIRAQLGLDDPFHQQYLAWLTGAVQGDLGQSLFSSESVAGAIAARFPVTLSVTAGAIVVSLLIAVPAGIAAAVHRHRWPDRAATLFTSAGIAIPNFWLGILLVIALALVFPVFPAVGYAPLSSDGVGAWLHSLALPSLTLGLAAAAETTRQLRSALSDTLARDYVRTARAKGLGEPVVVGKHALKNAMVPVATTLGFQVAFLLGGSVVVEQVFGLPGLGDLAVRAVIERDIAVIQGIVVVTALLVMLVNLAVDLTYAYLDPKVRYR